MESTAFSQRAHPSAYLHGNHPSLHDSTTSESWSMGSGAQHRQQRYPPHYLPKTTSRPQHQGPQQPVLSQAPQNSPRIASPNAGAAKLKVYNQNGTTQPAQVHSGSKRIAYAPSSPGGEYYTNRSSHGRLSVEPPSSSARIFSSSNFSPRSPSREHKTNQTTTRSTSQVAARTPSPSSTDLNRSHSRFGAEQQQQGEGRQKQFFEQQAHRPQQTRSEPGTASMDHDRFVAYVNRFAVLEQHRRESNKISRSSNARTEHESAHPDYPRHQYNGSASELSVDSGRVSDRVRKYNQKYPDPEPQLVSSDEDLQQLSSQSFKDYDYRQSSSGEERQAASPLVPSEEEQYQLILQQQGRSRAHKSSDLQGRSGFEQSPMHQIGKRRPSRSPTEETEPVYSNTPRSTISEAERLNQSVLSLSDSVERPSRASVKDLKRQLWDNDETLQVAIQPTLSYSHNDRSYQSDRRKTYYSYQAPEMAGRRGQRSSRSLSPGRRSMGSQEADQKFNSKYYEAAIAARLRGKVHHDEVIPRASGHDLDRSRHRKRDNSVERHFRDASVEPRCGRDSSLERRGSNRAASVDRRGGEQRSHRDVSIERRRESPIQHRGRESPMLVGPGRESTQQRGRESPIDRRTVGRDSSIGRLSKGREASVEQRSSLREPSIERGRVGRDASVERRKFGRDASVERRGRGFSVERRGTDFSVERRRGGSQERRPPRGDMSPSGTIRRSSYRGSPCPPSPNTELRSSTKSSVSGGKTKPNDPRISSSLHRSNSWHVSSVKPKKHDWAGKRLSGDNPPMFELAKKDSGRNIAMLVAKLNAVNRQDPTIALAEIDSILKAESRSSSGGLEAETSRRIAAEETDTRDRMSPSSNDEEGNDEDEMSEDETTVSSITNPTYQSARGGHDHVHIKGPNPFSPKKSATLNTALGHNPTNPFGQGPPSTAAFRRPRPSNLRSYVSPSQEAMLFPPTADSFIANKRKDAKGVAREGTLPSSREVTLPSSIKMDSFTSVSKLDGTSSAESPSPSPPLDEENVEFVKHAIGRDTSAAERNESIPSETRTGSENPIAAGQSKLDAFMSNSSALAQQIRVWDELSAGVTKSKSVDSGKHQEETNAASTSVAAAKKASPETKKALPKESAVEAEGSDSITKSSPIPVLPAPPQRRSVRRAHPWDSSIPFRHERLNAKDTSMENGSGIEMLIEKRHASSFAGFEGYNDAASLPESEVSNHKSKDVRRQDSRETQSVTHGLGDRELFDNSFGAAPPDPKHSADTAGGWEVSSMITPQQQENAKKISEDFDAAWVALPSSSLFPDFAPSTPPRREFPQDDPSTILTKRLQASTHRAAGSDFAPDLKTPPKRSQTGPVDLDDSFSQFTTPNSTREGVPPGNSQKPSSMLMNEFGAMQQFKDMDDFVEPGRIEVSLVDRSPALSQSQGSKSRNSPCRKRVTSTKEPEATPKRRGGFLSNVFGRKDRKKSGPAAPSKTPSRVSSSPKGGPPALPMLPLPNFDEKEMAPPPRGRKGDRTPGRGRSRSNSLERIRSSSMAEKFGRVMRLYEHE